MFTYAIKRAREIGKFNVVVVQRMLRKKRYARAKLLFCCYKKPRAFLPFSLPSPSLLSSVLLWSWAGLFKAGLRYESLKSQFSWILFVYNLMIEYAKKKIEKIIRGSAFDKRKRNRG